MGRYYHTNNHDGKFGFAVQSSNDPEIFGMKEQEPTTINYYLEDSKENRANIIKVLDEQYDILGIVKEDRLYEIENKEQAYDLLSKYQDKNYHEYDDIKDKGQIQIALDINDDKRYAPNNRYIQLAECRVVLGLCILDDLQKDGYCDMDAEG